MLPTVTEANFGSQVIESKLPVLVKFSAPWCQPCKQMTQTLINLGPELGNHIKFVEVDIEDSMSIAQMCNVRGLPTLAIFKNGQLLVTQEGNFPVSKVRRWIIDILGL